MIGECPKCHTKDVQLTKDHIIPKWAYKRFPSQIKGFQFQKNLGERNLQYICGPCNWAKGGDVDVSNPISLDFWTRVRDIIDKSIKKHEAQTGNREDTGGLGGVPTLPPPVRLCQLPRDVLQPTTKYVLDLRCQGERTDQ